MEIFYPFLGSNVHFISLRSFIFKLSVSSSIFLYIRLVLSLLYPCEKFYLARMSRKLKYWRHFSVFLNSIWQFNNICHLFSDQKNCSEGDNAACRIAVHWRVQKMTDILIWTDNIFFAYSTKFNHSSIN
jgi:hypothetical protein